MPYKSNNDLPDQVKDNLPEHAQDIYREAHDSSLDQYRKKRRGREDLEAVAHKVAWAAVKKEYKKDSDGKWIEK